MYAMVELEDTIRIEPIRFGENLDEVIEEMVHKTFEGTMRKKYGLIVVADNIRPVGDGKVIHGDGAMYQRVRFDALVFKPELQEVVDGVVCEVVEFGVFCHIGPLDALIHMSQIMNDYVEIDVENEMMKGKENKLVLRKLDAVRARVVALSLNELTPRESKIGLTMRQPGLGAHQWLKEGVVEKAEKGKKVEKERKAKRAKKKKSKKKSKVGKGVK